MSTWRYMAVVERDNLGRELWSVGEVVIIGGKLGYTVAEPAVGDNLLGLRNGLRHMLADTEGCYLDAFTDPDDPKVVKLEGVE